VGPATPATPAEFRFRPRFRALPWVCAVLGPGMLVVALATGSSGRSLTFAIVGAVLGPLVLVAYKASPAWRLRVVTDEEGLAVWQGKELRFRVPWWDVRRLVCSPKTHTCYVDGGVATRSLLVPGPGAPSFYSIERREELYEIIVAHVPPEVRKEVDLIELAMKEEQKK
jgi:hypothetical protein